MRFSLSASLARPHIKSGPAAVIDLLIIIQDPEFDTNLFIVQVKSIYCCQKISDRIVENHKTQHGVTYFSYLKQ